MQRGLGEKRAWASAYNGHGPRRNVGASHRREAVQAAFFQPLGLVSPFDRQHRLSRAS